jgi:hypothetical protein
MALGTITVETKAGFKPSAPDPVLDLSFAGDSDYHTNGTPTFQALVRAKAADQQIEVLGVIDSGCVATHYVVYDKATDCLKAFVRTTGLEVANHGDLHLVTFRVLAICK